MKTASESHAGLFLQRFTNSVNNALHKQNCTCNGKLYPARELIARSNPAVYNTQCRRRRRNKTPDKQMSVITSKSLQQGLRSTIPRDVIHRNISILNQYQTERTMERRYENKPLGCVETQEESEIKLPRIMEFTDKLGNNWNIVREGKTKAKNKINRKMSQHILSQRKNYDKALKPESILPSIDLSKNDYDDDDDIIHAVQSFNTLESEKNMKNEDRFTSKSEIETKNKQKGNLPLLNPAQQNILITTEKDLINSSQISSSDDVDRKGIRPMSKCNTLVTSDKIPYRPIEHFQKMAEIPSNFRCCNSKEKKGMPPNFELDATKTPLSKRRELITATISLDVVRQKLLQNSDSTNLLEVNTKQELVGTHNSLPPELQRLYKRKNKKCLSTKNLSLVDELPADFLQKDRDQIRSLYPMFDSRLESEEQRNVLKQVALRSVNHSEETNSAAKHDKDWIQFSLLAFGTEKSKVRVNQQQSIAHETRYPFFTNSESLAKDGNIIRLPVLVTSHIKRLTPLIDRCYTSYAIPPNQPPTTPIETGHLQKDSKLSEKVEDQTDALDGIFGLICESAPLSANQNTLIHKVVLQENLSEDEYNSKTLKYAETSKKQVKWDDALIDGSSEPTVPIPPPVTMEYCSSGQWSLSLKNISDTDTDIGQKDADDIAVNNAISCLRPAVQNLEVSMYLNAQPAIHVYGQKIENIKKTNGTSSTLEKLKKPVISTHNVVFVSPLNV